MTAGKTRPVQAWWPHGKPAQRSPAVNFAASPLGHRTFSPRRRRGTGTINHIALRAASGRMRKSDRCRDPHEFFNSLLEMCFFIAQAHVDARRKDTVTGISGAKAIHGSRDPAIVIVVL
ncbi:MAG: hypothetical protein K0U74_09090 [Alphaproteobacteria bacterium]|nr:hypothetical protein [Alphaproteobacteria bacterium]